jgi:hypothetical protein
MYVMSSTYLADPVIHSIVASGTGDRGLTVLKVIGGIVALCVLGIVVCLALALIRLIAPFVMIGSAMAALVGYIIGMYVICWWAIGAFAASAVGWAIYVTMSGE